VAVVHRDRRPPPGRYAQPRHGRHAEGCFVAHRDPLPGRRPTSWPPVPPAPTATPRKAFRWCQPDRRHGAKASKRSVV